MMYNILTFLNQSPFTVYAGAPKDSEEWNQSFEDGFTSFIGFLAADDVRIRRLTNALMCKLINDGFVSRWRKNQSSGAQTFKSRFWKST
jgi:neurofibromin 1